MTKQYAYASFYPGQPFPYEQAATPSDYLETALAAERYIASRQLEDADGVYWQEDGISRFWRNAADKPVILFPGDIRFGL